MKKQNEEQKNELEIIEPKPQYKIIYKSFYENNNLSADEIALLFKLITASPNFKPNARALAKTLKITIERLNKASKGLQEKGYLKIENNGKKGKKWTASQEPTLKAELMTFESLKNLFDTRYYLQLYKAKYIDLKTYNELIDYTCKIAKTEWIKKPNDDD